LTYKVTTVRLPEDMLRELNEIGGMLGMERSDVIREALRHGIRELKIRLAINLYVQEKISLGRATELAGLSQWQFIEELKRRGITLKYGEERFREEAEELCK